MTAPCPNLLRKLEGVVHADEIAKHDKRMCVKLGRALDKIVPELAYCCVPVVVDVDVLPDPTETGKFFMDLNAVLATKGYVVSQALWMPPVAYKNVRAPPVLRIVVSDAKHNAKRMAVVQKRRISSGHEFSCQATELF